MQCLFDLPGRLWKSFGDVMVSVLASSVVDQVKPKTIKLVFVASPLRTQH